MEMKKYNKARELRERIRQLKLLISRLESDNSNIGIQVIGLGADYPITKEMKSVLLGMCISEKAKLEKEFENL